MSHVAVGGVHMFGLLSFLLCAVGLSQMPMPYGVTRHDVDQQRYADLAAQPQFDCVGMVVDDTSLIGSGTLIAPRYVLTAAHIFIVSEDVPDTTYHNGAMIVGYRSVRERVMGPTEVSFVINGHRVGVASINIHPGYLATETKGSFDIAVVELMDTMPGVKPAIINTSNIAQGLQVVGVGFGASGIANDPATVGQYRRKVAGENVVDSIGGPLHNGTASELLCDFDHPTDPSANRLGSARALDLEYICSGGDSGGGLFSKSAGGWTLVGVCQGAAFDVDRFVKYGYYGQLMMWTRVSAFTGWIAASTQKE